ARSVAVLEDGVHHRGRGRRARRAGARVDVRALPAVPAVVGALLAEVDLLPRLLADVVDEEPRAQGRGVHGEAERVPEPPRERLLAADAGGRVAVLAARGARAHERV